MSRHAYVTLLTSDGYLPGALTLAAAIRETHDGNEQPYIVCIATPHTLDVASLRELRRAFDLVVAVEPLLHDGVGLDLLGRPDLHSVLTKLHVFRLTQFQKIIFLDADVLPVRSLAPLFDLPHEFSAVPDVGWPDIFNSGVMVLTPGEDKFNEIINLVRSRGTWDGGDQGVLNEWRGPNWNRLSFTYNTTPTAAYTYAPAYERFGSSINAIHFIGANKPWSGLPWRGPRSSNQPVASPAPSQQSHGYSDLVERWYDVYDRNYRPTGVLPEPQVIPPQQPTTAFQVPKYTNVWNLPVPRSSARGPARGGATMDLEQLRRLALEGVNSVAVQNPEDRGARTTPPRIRTPSLPGGWPDSDSSRDPGPGPGSGGTPSALIPVSSATMGVGYVGTTSSSFGGAKPEGKYVSMPLDGRVHLMSGHQLQSQAQQIGQPPPPSAPRPRSASPQHQEFPPPVTATSAPPAYLFRPKPQYASNSTSTSEEGHQQFFRGLPRRSPSPPRHQSSGLSTSDAGIAGPFRGPSREQRARSPEQVLGLHHDRQIPGHLDQPEQHYQVMRAEAMSPVRPPSPPMITWNPALEPPPDTLPAGAMTQHVTQYYQNVWDLPRHRDHHQDYQPSQQSQHQHPYTQHSRHEELHKDYTQHQVRRHQQQPSRHYSPPQRHDQPHTSHSPVQSSIHFPRYSQHSPPTQQQSLHHPRPRVHSYYSSSAAETPHTPVTHHSPRHYHHQHDSGRSTHHSPPHHTQHISEPHRPWERSPQQASQPTQSPTKSGSTSPQDRTPRQMTHPIFQGFPSPRRLHAPEAFFTPPPPPSIPSRLIREGHYSNIISSDPHGGQGPDPSKVHPIFPWESKPRRAPGRVFPGESSPPLSFLKPLVTPTQPSPVVPQAVEAQITEKARSPSPVAPVTPPVPVEEPPQPLLPGQRRYHYDWTKHQTPPVKLSPGSGPFPEAMAYANAWDHVPSIQKYASKLVTPGSILGFTSLGGGVTPRVEEDKTAWEERREETDASSHDGDDEDDESDLDVVLSDGGGKKRGGKGVRSPPRSGKSSRRGSTAADRAGLTMTSSKAVNTEKTYSSKAIGTLQYRSQSVQTIPKMTQSRGVQVSVISSPSILTLAPPATSSTSKPKKRRSKGSRTASLETSPEIKTIGLVGVVESAGVGPQPVMQRPERQRSSQFYSLQGDEDEENRTPGGTLSPRMNEPTQGFTPFREMSPHVVIKGTPSILTPAQGELHPAYFSAGGPIPRSRPVGGGADVPSHARDSSYTSVGNRDSMFTVASNRDSIYTSATTEYGDQPHSPQLSSSPTQAKPPSSPQYTLSPSVLPEATGVGGMPHVRTSSNETGLTIDTTSTTPPEPASPSEEPLMRPAGITSPTGSAMATPRRVSGRKWDPRRGVDIFKTQSQDVLARFLKMGTWSEGAGEGSGPGGGGNGEGAMGSPGTTTPIG